MKLQKAFWLMFLGIAVIAIPMFSQSPSGAKPSFEVATVKPNVSGDQFLLRVQSLIEDRLQLKMHREIRELPVYELVVAKGGSKVKLSEDQSPFRPPERGAPPPPPPQRGAPMPRGNMRLGRGNLEASGVPLANLVQALSNQLGRTVIDKTELKGLHDFKLQWTPDVGQGAVVPGGPEPVEVLVIDSVQKPTEN